MIVVLETFSGSQFCGYSVEIKLDDFRLIDWEKRELMRQPLVVFEKVSAIVLSYKDGIARVCPVNADQKIPVIISGFELKPTETIFFKYDNETSRG